MANGHCSQLCHIQCELIWLQQQWLDDMNESSIASSSGSTLPTFAHYFSKSESGNIHGDGNNLTKRDSDY